jgi:hypothetical protein
MGLTGGSGGENSYRRLASFSKRDSAPVILSFLEDLLEHLPIHVLNLDPEQRSDGWSDLQ